MNILEENSARYFRVQSEREQTLVCVCMYVCMYVCVYVCLYVLCCVMLCWCVCVCKYLCICNSYTMVVRDYR